MKAGEVYSRFGYQRNQPGDKIQRLKYEADQNQPVQIRPMSADGLSWSLDMAGPDPESHRLHLVASSGESLYFGDIAMKFTGLETSFEKAARN